jgi:ribonucleoside-diphosphate reductase alpha chain
LQHLLLALKLLIYHLNKIITACQNPGHPENDGTDRIKNKQLALAIKEARRAYVPENYIERVIQLSKLGFVEIYIPTYDTDWNSDAYSTVSGQNSNNSVRATNDFMKAVEMDDKWNLYWRVELQKSQVRRERTKAF